ncbi:hypothetical protein [Roseibium sp.]|uniref:hypothetical protein n=1 Tax=Roseibium sp. TaxID=1936156 RepID=UPI003A98131A
MPKRMRTQPADPVIRHRETAIQKRIRTRLDELQLTAIEAALLINAPHDTIRDVLRLEPGQSPDPETLSVIATALRTSVCWLENGHDPQSGMTVESDRIDQDLHAKATLAAVQSLETSGLVLEPAALSELILHLYKHLETHQGA